LTLFCFASKISCPNGGVCPAVGGAVFRFVVEEIPESGVEFSGELDAAWAAPYLGPQFSLAQDSITLFVKLSRAGASVAVVGHWEGKMTAVCSRCAEPFPYEFRQPFSHLFVKESSKPKVPKDIKEPEELDVTFFTGPVIDVEPLVGEELAIAFPAIPRCSDDCRGLCQRCGKNWNEGPCNCAPDVVDFRWEALKHIKIQGEQDANP